MYKRWLGTCLPGPLLSLWAYEDMMKILINYREADAEEKRKLQEVPESWAVPTLKRILPTGLINHETYITSSQRSMEC